MNESADYSTTSTTLSQCPGCGHSLSIDGGIGAARPDCSVIGTDGSLATNDASPRFCDNCGCPLTPATQPMMYAALAPPPTFWQRLRNQQPWGFWTTTGIAFSTILIHLVVGIIAVILLFFALSAGGNADRIEEIAKGLESNGQFVAVTTIVVSILTCAWLHAAIWPRGVPWRAYFAAHRPSVGAVILWLAILLAWLVVEEAYATYFIHDEKTSLFMNQVYESAGFMPLFLLGVVVAAPVAEEWLFRGFMFTGYAQSPVGIIGAIWIPSMLWAMMHLQYDVGYIGVIFVMGLLFGVARHLTGTIVIPIIMHMTCNLLATLQVAYDFHLFPVD